MLLHRVFVAIAILTLGCSRTEQPTRKDNVESRRHDPFGPNTRIDPDLKFERQFRCSEVGERLSRRFEEQGSRVAFYCYSPTLNTCVAVVDDPRPEIPSYVYDLLTTHLIAESSADQNAKKYYWFLNVRTSLGNECLPTGVDRLAGPIGKVFAGDESTPSAAITTSH